MSKIDANVPTIRITILTLRGLKSEGKLIDAIGDLTSGAVYSYVYT